MVGGRGCEKGWGAPGSSLGRTLILLDHGPTVRILFSPHDLLKALCPNTVTLGVSASIYLGGDTGQTIAPAFSVLVPVLSAFRVLLSFRYTDVEIEM